MEAQSAFGTYRPVMAIVCATLGILIANSGSADEAISNNAAQERGRYLAETVALCAHCHSEPNDEIDGRPPIESNYAGIDCPIIIAAWNAR